MSISVNPPRTREGDGHCGRGLISGGASTRSCISLLRFYVGWHGQLRHQFCVGVLPFVLRLSSRRRIRYDLNSRFGRRNLNLLSGCHLATIPHPDTVAARFKRIPLAATAWVRTQVVGSLIRKRRLERFRLPGSYYMIAIDGTETESFRHRHCEHCLTSTLENGGFGLGHSFCEDWTGAKNFYILMQNVSPRKPVAEVGLA